MRLIVLINYFNKRVVISDGFYKTKKSYFISEAAIRSNEGIFHKLIDCSSLNIDYFFSEGT